ncbi:MAG: glycoside hydrolase family 27 protein [Chitinophagales bacterium]
MIKKFSFLLLVFLSTKLFAQKFEGLALTPPMGWNSWNTFQTNISEQLVKDIADVMVSSGMKDAGYSYIVLDDGWMAMERDKKTGDLVPDPKKFPNGMKSLIDYVHSKGLKFGLYNCAGTKTCAGYPGTRGYEYQDARFYASLGIDYLKFDWCYTDGLNAKEAYTTMSRALQTAGRPIVFSLCEWGTNKPWQWAAPVGELWRTTGDISNLFDGILDHGTWQQQGIMRIVDSQDTIRKYAGPGHWNDPDMLEVGNGLTVAENRSHFSMWCMLAAPLIAGNDMRKMEEDTKNVLTNKDVIALNQDQLGIEALKYSDKDSLQVWFKPLKDDDWAVCFLNRSSKPKQIEINWQNETVNDDLSKKEFNAGTTAYKLRDLWLKKDIGDTKKPLKVVIASHDVLVLKLSK